MTNVVLGNSNKNIMRKTYTNGYLPKIAYHMAVTKDQSKVEYFEQRQLDTYGEFTDKQRWWLLEEIHNLTASL